MIEKDLAAETTCALRMEGEMTIYHAAELKQTLMSALKNSTSLEIDLSAVTEVDSVGIQLLILVKKFTQLNRSTLQLVSHSPAVIDAFELFNLIGYFGDPVVIAPTTPSGSARASMN